MCDSKVSGALSENEFYLALRLVALVQQKQEPTKELALKPSGNYFKKKFIFDCFFFSF